jgi:hypothetical protein
MQMLSDKMDCLQVASPSTLCRLRLLHARLCYGPDLCASEYLSRFGSERGVVICVLLSQEAHQALMQLEARARQDAQQGDNCSLTRHRTTLVPAAYPT